MLTPGFIVRGYGFMAWSVVLPRQLEEHTTRFARGRPPVTEPSTVLYENATTGYHPVSRAYLAKPERKAPSYYSLENGERLRMLLDEVCRDVFRGVSRPVYSKFLARWFGKNLEVWDALHWIACPPANQRARPLFEPNLEINSYLYAENAPPGDSISALYREAEAKWGLHDEHVFVVANRGWSDFWRRLGFVRCATIELEMRTVGRACRDRHQFACLARFPTWGRRVPYSGLYYYDEGGTLCQDMRS